MFCISVVFDIHPGHERAFGLAVQRNARRSLDEEPGCRVFDVCVDDSGQRFLLYELYDDEPAFQAHLAAPHFKVFDAEVGPWVAAKSVRRWRRLDR
ncbi:MAG: antibiotic biosynthesis monooxygenase [Leptolyngbyaceae cyanobacterium SU_3_3]|nr:antibiotic biosynthesis monooxygenase [Leptolyngbyaceae cyanobacterium SU_3_3]